MAGRRVKWLRFRVGSQNQTTYQVDEPLEFSNLYGRFRFELNALTVWPEQSFSDSGTAVEEVVPFLQSWEIQSDLDLGVGTLRFSFEAAELESSRAGELNPIGLCPVTMEAHSKLVARDEVFAHVTRNAYPTPPEIGQFGISEYLVLAHRRWLGYVRKREPLPSTAYFIFTIFEQLGGGSKTGAAAKFEIEFKVLDTLSRLSSVSGSAEIRRKFDAGRSAVEMTDTERTWIEAVVLRLVRRLGEFAAGATLNRIRMLDLPAGP